MKKKKLILVLVTVLMVTGIAVSAVLTASSAPIAVAAAGDFQKTDELKIAHITDSHYYPLNYNHKAGNVENPVAHSTAMYLESGAFNYKSLTNVIEEAPDYLFVTGDLTLNGEIGAHIEYSNLLRWVQNEIRAKKGNDNFQIFVTVGNHDMYNLSARLFYKNGRGEVAPYVTRMDITKLYAGLGFPDLTNEEMDAYYATKEVLTNDLPYTTDAGKPYINSKNSASINYVYQYAGKEAQADYDNGEISYIAYCPNNYVVVSMDAQVSNAERNHITGGYIYAETRQMIDIEKAANKLNGKTLLGITHQNLVPHFDYEDSLLKDFVLYDWRKLADYLADIGMRYVFTGHMHCNDLVGHVSFDGNPVIDIETSSITGHNGAVRYTTLQRGTADGVYAENFYTRIEVLDEVNLSKLINLGYTNDNYFINQDIMQFIQKSGSVYTCTDPSGYASKRIFLNIVDNMMAEYMNINFVMSMQDMLGGMLEKIPIPISTEKLKPLIAQIMSNLIDHLNDVVLADYTYSGTKYTADEQGGKVFGFLDDLASSLINLEVNSRGDTLVDFFFGCYFSMVGGYDTPEAEADPYMLETLDKAKSGELVAEILNTLLYKNGGLMKIVDGLAMPIDLGKGMSDKDKNTLSTLLDLFSGKGYKTDLSKVVLDAYLKGILNMAGSMMNIGIDIQGDSLTGIVEGLLDSYVTDSLYSGLGEIVHNIMRAFLIDETPDGAFGADELCLLFGGKTTYVAGMELNSATIENGKLPSMLTVTFGDDPKADKSFVWFTDIRVTDTVIQYCEGEFDAATARTANGEFDIYATTTAGIDLGVFCTLIEFETGRHSLELKGLKAGTEYSYRVGSAARGFWSDVYTMKTAPGENDTPFELLLLSDLQGFGKVTYEKADRVMNGIDGVFENGWDFVINAGDLVDNSRNIAQYENMLNVMRAHWGNTTQVTVSGNHDVYNYEFSGKLDTDFYITTAGTITDSYNYHLLHYNISSPAQDTVKGGGAYYSFDYSGVHFTILNTNDMASDKSMSAAQIEWLKNDLAGTDKIKVVAMHKGIYSAGSHVRDTDVVKMRAQLTSIFADYGVSLVLQGHDHTYSESYYLDRDGKVVAGDPHGSKKVGGEGVLYVNLGTMGDKFYKYVEDENVPIEFGKKKHNPTLSNPTFGKLVFDGESIYYTGYQYDLETDRVIEIRKMAANDIMAASCAMFAIACSCMLIVVCVLRDLRDKVFKVKI